MVHYWACLETEDSSVYKTFLSDMSWGLDETDLEEGNFAYVRSDLAISYRDKLIPYK